MRSEAIGIIKIKKAVWCEICGSKAIRQVSAIVLSGDDPEITKAKLMEKIQKKYTCNVCKSIIKEAKKS
jgi:DNA-directed RNA polymerase subunit RPC12/RpoP